MEDNTFPNYLCACSGAHSCPTLVTCRAPLSLRFPRQVYWNDLPFPTLGDLLEPEIKLTSPALQTDSFPLSHLGSSAMGNLYITNSIYFKRKSLVLTVHLSSRKWYCSLCAYLYNLFILHISMWVYHCISLCCHIPLYIISLLLISFLKISICFN